MAVTGPDGGPPQTQWPTPSLFPSANEVHHHHFHHRDARVHDKLDAILSHILRIEHRELFIMVDLAGVQSEVAQYADANHSALALIDNLVAALHNASGDQAAVDKLAADLHDQRTALASAVAAVGDTTTAPPTPGTVGGSPSDGAASGTVGPDGGPVAPAGIPEVPPTPQPDPNAGVIDTGATQPPADQPPADVPPAETPPADVPPADVPPADAGATA